MVSRRLRLLQKTMKVLKFFKSRGKKSSLWMKISCFVHQCESLCDSIPVCVSSQQWPSPKYQQQDDDDRVDNN